MICAHMVDHDFCMQAGHKCAVKDTIKNFGKGHNDFVAQTLVMLPLLNNWPQLLHFCLAQTCSECRCFHSFEHGIG